MSRATEKTADEPEAKRETRSPRRDLSGLRETVVTTLLAIVMALLVGAVLISLSYEQSLNSLSYFFSYPWDFFRYSWDAVSTSYLAMVDGSVGSPGAIVDTLERSAPLICAGLGVTLAFRAGLFNIGAQGQLIVAALAAGYVGWTWDLPPGIHLVVSVAAGVLAGGLYGGIVGLLKAQTGAHEVITTIMFNYIASLGILAWALFNPAFQRPGQSEPISDRVADSAAYPSIGSLHLGIVVALLAAVFLWWLLDRSTLGFELRAVGSNPDAARTAGISVSKAYTVAMLLAGAFAGLAATMLVNGDRFAISDTLFGTIGFDAITVALLGRGKPLGSVLAGLLFGALQVGGGAMEATRVATSPDLAQVLQALIVLFVAAPALVGALIRRRDRDRTPEAAFAAKAQEVEA